MEHQRIGGEDPEKCMNQVEVVAAGIVVETPLETERYQEIGRMLGVVVVVVLGNTGTTDVDELGQTESLDLAMEGDVAVPEPFET